MTRRDVLLAALVLSIGGCATRQALVVPEPRAVALDGRSLDSLPQAIPASCRGRIPSSIDLGTGRVILEFTIDSTGTPVPGTGHALATTNPRLAAPSVSFVSTCGFTVPKVNGRPVAAIIRFPMNYEVSASH